MGVWCKFFESISIYLFLYVNAHSVIVFQQFHLAVKSVIAFLVISTFHNPHTYMHIPVCVHSKRRHILGIKVEIIGVRTSCVFYDLHQNILQNTSFAGKIIDVYGAFNRISYVICVMCMLRQQEMYRVCTSIRSEYNSTIAELAPIQESKFHLRTRKNMQFFFVHFNLISEL